MRRVCRALEAGAIAGVVCAAAAAIALAQTPASKPAAQTPAPPAAKAPALSTQHSAPGTDLNATLKRYCVGCHNETGKTKAGDLSLASFDTTKAAQNPEVAERMIRKLQAGFMPPPRAPRPDPQTYAALIASLETQIDAAAAAKPNPGQRVFQRLNRPEYARAVRDLLALDVDAGNWLPLDTKSANFDNIADAQSLSPTLLESYLNAASAISRMAVGDRQAPAQDASYSAPGYVSQHPWGS